jgi:hypothetical protein
MISVLILALVLASTGLLSPGSITLVILLLLTGRGWMNEWVGLRQCLWAPLPFGHVVLTKLKPNQKVTPP